MKICTFCKHEKSHIEFVLKNKKTGQLHSRCKECQSNYSKQHYIKHKSAYKLRAYNNTKLYRKFNQKSIIEYLLTKSCVDCGNADIRVLDFDHVNIRTKKSEIGKLIRSSSWSSVLDEIQKCEIRCANCHRIKTAKQFNTYRHKFIR